PYVLPRSRRGDQPLEHPRLGDRTLLERDDEVAGLDPRRLGWGSVHHVDDEDPEALAHAVTGRDLVHLLLGQIADAYAEPRPLGRVDRRRRHGERQNHHGQHPDERGGPRPHSRPRRSSFTSWSSTAPRRSRRRVTSSVSKSSWRSAASGTTAAAIRSAMTPGAWPAASAVSSRSGGRASASSRRPHASRMRASAAETSVVGATSSSF